MEIVARYLPSFLNVRRLWNEESWRQAENQQEYDVTDKLYSIKCPFNKYGYITSITFFVKNLARLMISSQLDLRVLTVRTLR